MKETFRNQKDIDRLKTPESGRAVAWDSTVKHLGVSMQATGGKSYVWAGRFATKLYWKVLADCDAMSLDQARARASEINASMSRWKDEGCKGLAPIAGSTGALTLNTLFEQYVAEHLRVHSSVPKEAEKDDRRYWNNDLVPLHNREISQVTHAELRELRASIQKKHDSVTMANRAIQLVKRVVNHAIHEDRYKGINPACIKRLHEEPRDRYVQPAELPRLFGEMKKSVNRDLVDNIILELFTGARKKDILAAKWNQISADHIWRIPKPKNRKPYSIALIAEAVEVIERRRNLHGNSEWVFPSKKSKSGHLEDLKAAWSNLRRKAGLQDLTQHDLRRTLGSYQAAQGSSLVVIGASLGHADVASTQIYSRLDLSPVKESVQRAAIAMLTLAAPKMS